MVYEFPVVAVVNYKFPGLEQTLYPVALEVRSLK